MRLLRVAIASLGLLACGSAKAQDIQLRVIPAPFFDSAGVAIPFDSGDDCSGSIAFAQPVSMDFYVQARVLDPSASSLTTFTGRLHASVGGFSRSALSATEVNGVVTPGSDPEGRSGLFPRFRAVLQDDNSSTNGASGGVPTQWVFRAVNLAAPDGACIGDWCEVYRVTWTADLADAQRIEIRVQGEFGGVTTPSGLRSNEPIVPGGYYLDVGSPGAPLAFDCNSNAVFDLCEIEVDPSIDCDTNGVPDTCDLSSGAEDCDANGVLDTCQIRDDPGLDANKDGLLDDCLIDIADLLAFLNAWFMEDLSADADGSGEIDVVDLLTYLACWFVMNGLVGSCP